MKSGFWAALGFVLCMLAESRAGAENWPGWRGPRGDGTSEESSVPRNWNGPSEDNVAWKTKLPGWGHSSPVVWQDALFVTACDDPSGDRVLLKLDVPSGRIVWQRAVVRRLWKNGIRSTAMPQARRPSMASKFT